MEKAGRGARLTVRFFWRRAGDLDGIGGGGGGGECEDAEEDADRDSTEMLSLVA